MKAIFVTGVLFLVSLATQNAAGQASSWQGTCEVTFKGTSTLHNFTGTVSAEPFTVGISGLDNPTQARASSEITVKVSKMSTDHKKRDAAMMKALDAVTFPEIAVMVADLAPEATKPKLGGAVPQPTVIPFTMKLKGKKLQINAAVTDWSYAEGAISYTVTFPVSLAKAGIKPPSVLGLVKVDDRIDVSAKVVLKRS